MFAGWNHCAGFVGLHFSVVSEGYRWTGSRAWKTYPGLQFEEVQVALFE